APATDAAVQRIGATTAEAGPDLAPPAETGDGAAAPNAGAAPAAAGPDPTANAAAVPGAEPANSQATPAPAGNRGEQLLAEAKALYTNANYAAALQLANQAKAGKFGVEARAGELIAQINL